MARAELGNKHTCLNCGVKFYDLNKFEIICPACGTEVTLTSDEPQVQLQTTQKTIVDEDIVQDNVELEQEKEPLDNNLEGGVIEDDNPIIMDDDDILDDESEEELINENEIVSTLTSVFPSSNWMEREVFDMYGIKFKDHPDLRRILTDYGFEGYPLRKDFPLTGHKEVRYSEDDKKVVYEDVKLEQNYRNFDYESPWEGTEYIKKQTKK